MVASLVRALLLVHSASAQFGGGVTFGSGGADRVEYVFRPLGRGGGGGFGGIVPGALMLAASVGLLWWNEGRTLREERMLHEAHQAVLSIDGDAPSDGGGSTSDERLLHVTGKLASNGVRDGLFPSVGRPALRLRRVAEAYQWKETKHTHEERVSSTYVKRET